MIQIEVGRRPYIVQLSVLHHIEFQFHKPKDLDETVLDH